jgi:hypothetical protein
MADLSCIPKFVKKELTDTWVAEAWKLMLLSKAHTPNAGTQQYVSDVVANEITDGGPSPKYTAGGVVVSGKVSLADGNNYSLDLADKIIGPGASLNYRYGVLFQDTGNPATSKIRVQVDFIFDQIVDNGTSTIKWNALGLIYVA